MNLILITTDNDGTVITEKEISLMKQINRKEEFSFVLPDDFSMTLFLEDATDTYLSR